MFGCPVCDRDYIEPEQMEYNRIISKIDIILHLKKCADDINIEYIYDRIRFLDDEDLWEISRFFSKNILKNILKNTPLEIENSEKHKMLSHILSKISMANSFD